MTEKRFNVFDVDGTVFLEDHKEGSYHIGEKENVDIPCLNDIADRLNTYADENEQLKKRCKELRNDLIDHSALINMLEKAKALKIEDMIWNTIGYKTQTEFDDDFADYREDAKKRWKE